jgi:DNA-binding CsgD family transcriptional regulator
VVNRPFEFRSVSEFLRDARSQPSGLIIEGEAGIGKTTLWLSAVEHARTSGFRVLHARIGPTESVLAYTAVADLLRDIPAAIIATLPDVQHIAIDHVLLRAGTGAPATDQRVVAAALVSVVERLTDESPVLVAIDNFQWLDQSSRAVIAFATRRFSGRVGILVTERCDPTCGTAMIGLQLSRPERMNRITLGPLSLGGLHALISARLGRTFPRPTMVRIAEVSGGNPFYALELARAFDSGLSSSLPELPGTLAELMRLRITGLDADVRDILLPAAAIANPTVEMLARVRSTTVEHVFTLLEEAESQGVVTIDGDSVRFSHPLLAHSLYTEASRARRRATHRALAKVVQQPELKARHMALAASSADAQTLQALDTAADAAAARGAPAASAELLELAIQLGGDKPSRRIRAAEQHFKAGDAGRARTLLESTIDDLKPGLLRAVALNLLAGIRVYDDNFSDAAALLKRAVVDAEINDAVLVQTLIMLAFTEGMSADFDDSYANAGRAVKHAEQLGVPVLISRALAMWANLTFQYGRGVDEDSIRRAVELEDPSLDVPMPLCASAIQALLLAWTGRLDEAREAMMVVRNRCVDRGAESDLMAVSGYLTLIEMWRGNFVEATALAEETMERAEQVGGSCAIALTVRGAVAAYAGREQEARADAAAAIEVSERCNCARLAEWPRTSLGFLELSLGNHDEALKAMQPLLSNFEHIPGIEIMTGAWIPDAVEAMITLGRHADALPLIEALENHGGRLDRAWMLAAAYRCRGMWMASRGDVDAAELMARKAMFEHNRVPMPFERARTQLLLGQLLRRKRQKESATAALREALAAFEAMGAPLWAQRARAELARTNVTQRQALKLTPSEQRVAELAASGMTNRDVAAALFISPKTVEANLARIYRKLGIKSRAELGRLIGESP